MDWQKSQGIICKRDNYPLLDSKVAIHEQVDDDTIVGKQNLYFKKTPQNLKRKRQWVEKESQDKVREIFSQFLEVSFEAITTEYDFKTVSSAMEPLKVPLQFFFAVFWQS